MPIGLPEFVDNPEPRCPVILLCDTSGSMSGEPINALNAGLAAFKEDVYLDEVASLRVEVALVTFGPVQLAQDFVTIDNFTSPRLFADGGTPMGEAIEYALDLLERRKVTYKNNGIQYYRPWMFLITDGAPTDRWYNAAQQIRQAEAQRRLLFFAVGVKGADMNTLRQIALPERPPVVLDGLKFREMFHWLSTSMKRVSSSQVGGTMIALPPVGWGQIAT
ncbi:vWA domain-containing protein [Aliterella atlantica]|uniref:von Willebrand factor type A n=1 Tax=Aliterella atlantica CENA595 TaxID=1618023 RepID=A0A0D8ZPP0_9CYAN|nr:VWA domain-containing protein [Aliterella atlantica]KJH70312.1 von Willebrand factor type A [Aliterella atlantica CENA595]